jgi:hypothetical protein
MRRALQSSGWPHVFGVPLGIAAVSCLGFAAAFLFGAIGQWLSWAGLGSPLAIIVWVIVRELFQRRL